MSDMQNVVFQDETKAREWLEKHLWPHGPVCPHCGTTNEATLVQGKKHSHRDGLYMCNSCRQQFTVTVGTIFERSHVPLNKWLQATFLLCSSKKGISSHQLHRMLGVTYKTAWFMSHRIREAMKNGDTTPFGQGGKFVESDETYIGRKPGRKKAKAGAGHKLAVMSLVERGGAVRSFHMEDVTAKSMYEVLAKNVSREANLRTDELAFTKAWAGISPAMKP